MVIRRKTLAMGRILVCGARFLANPASRRKGSAAERIVSNPSAFWKREGFETASENTLLGLRASTHDRGKPSQL
jgi:hypothetical protein